MEEDEGLVEMDAATEEKMKIIEWRLQYQKLLANPPKEGDFLYADSNMGKTKKTKLTVECATGKQPLIYGRVFIPNICGQELGWFTQAEGVESYYGWKCILLPKARNEVISKYGLVKSELAVRALRVVRKSQTGQSLLVEVADY